MSQCRTYRKDGSVLTICHELATAQAEVRHLRAVLLEALQTSTALHDAEGRIWAYQIYPKNMQGLIDYVAAAKP